MKALFASLLFVMTVWADEPKPISTSHTVELSSGPLSYTATTGSLPCYDDETNEVLGSIGYTAYTLDPGNSDRPITFVFNGGPGSSSILLHTYGIGPKRALSPLEGQSATPPYKMIDNDTTLLDLSDLVFVDPMSSGLSRPAEKKEPLPFYHSENDAIFLSEFIRDYITKFGRWNSPKYIAGESYGTFRACTMARYLQGNYGIYLNGLVLISCALEYQTLIYDYDNPLPYFLYLPTYAVTAWYHGLAHVGKTLEQVVKEARTFAQQSAAPYYLQPYRYTTHQKQLIWKELAELTGLGYQEIYEENGKFTEDTYFTRLFPQKLVGRYDTTLVGPTSPSNKRHYDLSSTCLEGALVALFNDYFTGELETKITYPAYTSFSDESFRYWQWPRRNYFGYPTALDALRDSLLLNPALKVYVGNGYYDAATPFAATEHSIASLDLPDSYQANIQMEYYEGGHMYYLHSPARIKFKQDLIKFYGQ